MIREPSGDRRVVGRRAAIGAGRQPPSQVQRRRPAVGLELGQHLGHVLGAGADGDIGVVLGRRADHRRSADVDVLHARVEARAGRHGLLERVEVHIDEVDADDAVFLHGPGMLGGVADAEKAAVHHRMQGLHPAIHHLGKAGELGDVLHRQAGGLDRLAGAAGGDQLDPEPGEGPRRLDKTGLVRDGDQRALESDPVWCGREIGGGGHGRSPVRGMPRRAAKCFRAPRWCSTIAPVTRISRKIGPRRQESTTARRPPCPSTASP